MKKLSEYSATELQQMVKVDYPALEQRRKERRVTGTTMGRVLGFTKSWYGMNRDKNREMAMSKLLQIAMYLDSEVEEFILEDAPQTETNSGNNTSADLTPVLHALEEITQLLKSQNSMLMYLFNQKQQAENAKAEAEEKDELQISCNVLKKMLERTGGIKMTDYLEAVKKEGVNNEKIADAAIAKLGYHKTTKGFNDAKVKWIYKPVEL